MGGSIVCRFGGCRHRDRCSSAKGPEIKKEKSLHARTCHREPKPVYNMLLLILSPVSRMSMLLIGKLPRQTFCPTKA